MKVATKLPGDDPGISSSVKNSIKYNNNDKVTIVVSRNV